MDRMNEIADSVIRGRGEETSGLVKKALDEHLDVERILRDGLIIGMNIVGEGFKKGDLYIPEVILSARAMKMGMEILKPVLIRENVARLGVAVVATVKGDLHDIGKNLVCMMLEGAGFEVIDLGIDVPEEKVVKAVKEKQPNILGLSALLTTTMPAIKEAIKALEATGLRDKVKVLVGGAPVTEEYANQVGADGYAANAALAVDRAKELLERSMF